MSKFAAILEKHPARDDALPVIFNGVEPRFIGRANSLTAVDLLLISQRLTARYLSTAVEADTGIKFFVAHGS